MDLLIIYRSPAAHIKNLFSAFFRGPLRHRRSMHTKNYTPALTESIPFAINSNLNFSWFPLPGRSSHKAVYLLC